MLLHWQCKKALINKISIYNKNLPGCVSNPFLSSVAALVIVNKIENVYAEADIDKGGSVRKELFRRSKFKFNI